MDPYPSRPRAFAVAAVVALIQGLALIGNAGAVALAVIRDGITGPSDVASPAGVAVEVLLFLVFGGVLVWIGAGFLRGRTGALTGFLLAQLLGLAVTVPLTGADGAARTVGWLGVGLCVIGLAAWVMLVRYRLAEPDQ